MSLDPTRVNIFHDPTKRIISGYTAHGGKSFSMPLVSQITETIWQGGCIDGLILPNNIEHVVSLYPWERYVVHNPPVKTEHYYWAYDSTDQSTTLFDKVAELVSELDGTVLVHCQAGLNRSSAVVGIAMQMIEGISGEEAVNRLRERRSPAALCNPAFEKYVLNGCA